MKPIVRARIEALADYVELHNEGALRGTDALIPFTQAQAETYCRFYEGYKREVQEQSIEAGLIPEDDPLYGWGWLAQHEPSVRLVGASQQSPVTFQGKEFVAKSLEQKRNQAAELLVVKRPHLVPTTPMYILHATVLPTIIPDITVPTLSSRIARVKSQVKSPGMVERLARLGCRSVEGGVLLQATRDNPYTVGPINTMPLTK